MYRKIMMFFVIIAVSLSLVLGLFSVISWEVVAVLIAVFVGIPGLILTQVNVKPKEGRREQEVGAEEREILREETIRVGPQDNFHYIFELKRNEVLKGEISSDSHIDIYFVDNTNFKKWDKGRVFFDCEYSNESILKTKIDYLVPRKGTWYLLVENNGRKTAIVKVYLYLSNSD